MSSSVDMTSSYKISSWESSDDCFDHNQHSESIMNDITLMNNEINHLIEQLNHMMRVQSNCFVELEHWRENGHQLIEQLFEKRKQNIEEFVYIERNKQKEKIDQLRNQIKQSKLNQDDISSMQNTIQLIKQQIEQFNLTQFIPSPLLLTNHFPLHQNKSISINPPISSSTYRNIKLKEPLSSMAIGDNIIVVVSDNNLCLLNTNLVITKKIPWISTDLYDIIWSTALGQFLLITPQEIFLFNPNRLVFEQFPLGENSIISDWLCGTSFNNKLILSTRSRSSSIYEYSLLPSIKFNKEYSPPISCQHDQFILDLSSNNTTLIVILTKNLQNFIYLDLCSSNTFERYWSNRLDTLPGRYRIRSCALNDNHWLIINRNKSELLRISSDGKLLRNETYDPSPCHAVSLQNDTLAILTIDGIHFHQLS